LVAYRSFSMISWYLNVSMKDRQQGVICKKQKGVDIACYIVAMRITGASAQRGRRVCSAACDLSPHSCLLAASPRDVDALDPFASSSWAPVRPTASSLASATENIRRHGTAQYALCVSPQTNLSSPISPPPPCGPSAFPGTLSTPPSRPNTVLLHQLRPESPPWAPTVAMPL